VTERSYVLDPEYPGHLIVTLDHIDAATKQVDRRYVLGIPLYAIEALLLFFAFLPLVAP
jgi:hypothetical protein